jgi:hypothetical protein
MDITKKKDYNNIKEDYKMRHECPGRKKLKERLECPYNSEDAT